jgi:membrane-bound metal-dependent hydrolase YbcI (DUF457 family)
MLIGHVGAALAGKRARRSIGLLGLLIATYVPDWADIGLCLASVSNPMGMLTHSIPAVLLFMLVGFTAYAAVTRDWTGALVMAVVILSHMLFDWITGYKPTWPGGPMIGLQLYDHPIADFVVEAIVIVAGAILYGRTLPPRRRPWVDVSIMAGALLTLQLTVDIARLLLKHLPKC